MENDTGISDIDIEAGALEEGEHSKEWSGDRDSLEDCFYDLPGMPQRDNLRPPYHDLGNTDGCFRLQNGKISACSVIGPRKNNEDSVGYDQYRGYDILAISDGVGGAQHGEVASDLATKNFVRAAKRLLELDTHPHEVIVRAAYSANRSICNVAKAFPVTHGEMCCTFIGAIVKDRTVYMVHIGDSRAYVVSPGNKKQIIRQLTKDHNLFEILKDNSEYVARHALSGQLADDLDVLDDPHLVFEGPGGPYWGSAIARVMGDPVIQPDYFTFDLKRNDVLLLCTDGVSNAISTEKIGEAVAQADIKTGYADAIIKAVADRSPNRHGSGYVDNTTALAYYAGSVVSLNKYAGEVPKENKNKN